jgi:hypothetical protein
MSRISGSFLSATEAALAEGLETAAAGFAGMTGLFQLM